MDAGKITIWERIERPAAAPRSTLSHRQIAAEAVELADAEGLDAVSMRRLAAKLGVAAMALYRYVTSKQELFELMVDEAYAESQDGMPDEPCDDWRGVLRAMARANRARMLRHPWLAQAHSQALTALTPHQLAGAEHVLQALKPLDLDPDTALAVMDTVNEYSRGSAAREVTILQIMRREGWENLDDVRGALRPNMMWLMSTGRYPQFLRWVREATRKDDNGWRFEFGLDCVLDGIAARLGLE
jgi:AcrR family transcriptional regulator